MFWPLIDLSKDASGISFSYVFLRGHRKNLYTTGSFTLHGSPSRTRLMSMLAVVGRSQRTTSTF